MGEALAWFFYCGSHSFFFRTFGKSCTRARTQEINRKAEAKLGELLEQIPQKYNKGLGSLGGTQPSLPVGIDWLRLN